MRILLTNDDGYDAPGLRALWEAVGLLADVDIDVVAPECVQSGKGHSISRTILCRKVSVEPIGEVVTTDGTPADCVRAALALPGRLRPQWVIAGINRGSNLGVDVYYSGTVAAAASTVGSRPNRRTAADVTGLRLAILQERVRIQGPNSRIAASAIAPLVTVTQGDSSVSSRAWVAAVSFSTGRLS